MCPDYTTLPGTQFDINARPELYFDAMIEAMDTELGRYPIVWAAAGTGSAVCPVPPATLRLLANAEVASIAEDSDVADRTGPGVGRAPAPDPGR